MEIRIVKTFFSYPPREGSRYAVIITILLCMLFSRLYWEADGFSQYLAASGFTVFKNHEYWRLVSTIFVHSDFMHLASNSYMLGILTYFVYGYFGLTIFPIIALIGAALTNAISIATYNPNVTLVGASGLVYFLAGFWLALFALIERKWSLPNRLIRTLGVGLMILFPTSFEPEVSYRTHVIGFLLGLVFAIVYFIKNIKRIRAKEVTIVLEDTQEEPDFTLETDTKVASSAGTKS